MTGRSCVLWVITIAIASAQDECPDLDTMIQLPSAITRCDILSESLCESRYVNTTMTGGRYKIPCAWEPDSDSCTGPTCSGTCRGLQNCAEEITCDCAGIVNELGQGASCGDGEEWCFVKRHDGCEHVMGMRIFHLMQVSPVKFANGDEIDNLHDYGWSLCSFVDGDHSTPEPTSEPTLPPTEAPTDSIKCGDLVALSDLVCPVDLGIGFNWSAFDDTCYTESCSSVCCIEIPVKDIDNCNQAQFGLREENGHCWTEADEDKCSGYYVERTVLGELTWIPCMWREGSCAMDLSCRSQCATSNTRNKCSKNEECEWKQKSCRRISAVEPTPDPTQAPGSECVNTDSDDDCKDAKEQGSCTNDLLKDIFRSVCKKTCGCCDVASTETCTELVLKGHCDHKNARKKKETLEQCGFSCGGFCD